MNLNFNNLKITRVPLLVLFAVASCLTSCLDEFEGNDIIILTEELLELNSEEVTMLGRLVATTQAPTEVGFYLATDPDFNLATVLPSENTPSIGLFIVSTNELTFNTQYYAKSYVVVAGDTYFGETISFSSNLPVLVAFDPMDAAAGDQVTISGLNITEDVQVAFGSRTAEIVFSENRTTLQVIVPEIENSATVDVELIMKGSTFKFDTPFTYHTGLWTKVSEYPTTEQLTGCVVLDIGDEVVVGYGREIVLGESSTTLFSVNKSSFVWSSFEGPSGSDVVSDPINYGDGFGGGTIESLLGFLVQSSQSWTYDVGTSSWVSNPALTIPNLSATIHVELNGLDYAFGGINADLSNNRGVWIGDIADGTFSVESVADFDILDSEAHFVYNNEFYYQRDAFTIVKYDPVNLEWEDFFATRFNLGTGNVALVIGDKVLFGLGTVDGIVYEIDLQTGDFIEKNLFPAATDEENVAHWQHNNKLYVLRSSYSLDSRIKGIDNMELWELDPTALK